MLVICRQCKTVYAQSVLKLNSISFIVMSNEVLVFCSFLNCGYI